MATLPEHVKVRVLALPEYKMGAHKVALTLKDGRVVDNVIVAWGDEIVSVGGVAALDFDPNDVVDVEGRG